MSGNRLAGDDGNRGADDERVAARLTDQVLVQRLEDFRDETGESKSEVLRAALDEYLPDPNSQHDHPEPEDPTLAKAYNILRARYDGYVMRSTAAAALAEQLSFEGGKDEVWKQILVPLKRNGWLATSMDAEFQHSYVKTIVPQRATVSGSQGVAPADD